MNKDVKVKEHHRNLLLSKKNKHMSSACNSSKIDSQDVISKVVCVKYKKCLNSINHDVCLNSVNGKQSRSRKHKANVSKNETQKEYRSKVSKSKNVGPRESLATPKPRKPRLLFRWSPTGKMFDSAGKIFAPSGCSKHMTGNLKLLINFVWKFMGTVRFGNDHVAAILGFGDLQWGHILITRVYFVEGLGHNLFSVGQFCDSNLEVAFRRNACFVRNLEGVDLLKGDHSTNLYTINLHEMASASPICLMARASSTKSWLWHQRLSHLNFNTINDLAKKDLVAGLPKFKYHKEYLCPSFEQGKSKRKSHPPKPVPNSRQRLHLLHMDLCGPMRITSINGKRYILVIVDDYSRYTWVHFLRSKDEAPVVIITFLKRITDVDELNPNAMVDGNMFVNPFAFSSTSAAVASSSSQNRLHLLHMDLCGPKRIASINEKRKPDISFLHVFGALCYPKNDRADNGKLGAKGLDLTDASSTITKQQPTKGELDVLFEALYDDYFGGQPSANVENVSPAQEPQVRQTSTASTTIADNVPIPTNSSSHATNIPITSQDVDELNSNAMVDGNTFVNPVATSSSNAAETSSSQNDSGFELTGFSDADYARCKDSFKSTSGGAQFLGEKLANTPLPLEELNIKEIKIVKSSIDEPPKLELKELPSHLEIASDLEASCARGFVHRPLELQSLAYGNLISKILWI
nr:retrovirus-related Pol polyprotein from transposon TNT 1-94 [Tanacetum cinerariifolium]